MTTVAEWARFDAYVIGILATMLKTGRSAAMAMFAAANNQRAQKEMVVAAAKTILDQDDFELLELIFRKVAPLRKQRNQIAHSIWLSHPSLPRELICADPVALGAYQGHHADTFSKPGGGKDLTVTGLEQARIWDELDALLAAEHAIHAVVGVQRFCNYLMLGRNDWVEVDSKSPRRLNFRAEVKDWIDLKIPTKSDLRQRLQNQKKGVGPTSTSAGAEPYPAPDVPASAASPLRQGHE
ncbi:hypothetical protein ACQQ2N_19040 [Dokdonella sp. MW10]|uniref:hypothetical protein n=1 Tax=Dokdonella sp. MW10 TaxID=2992926 RepID=UPI003F7E9E8D